MNTRVKAVGLVLATCVALLVLTGTAAAATTPPFVRSGTLTVGAGSVTDPVSVKFSGTIPNLKKGEYVAYYSTSLDGPSGPKQCNPLGIDVDAGPTKPKRKQTVLYPEYGMEWPSNEQARWCGGKWIVQAFVYRKQKDGGYHPRLVFARKKFSIG